MANYYGSTIQKGSSGDDVLRWQRYLNRNYGLELTEDGIFGDETLSATKDFQLSNNLTADGIVGDDTWGLAGFTYQGGSNSSSSGNSSTSYTPTDLPTIDTTTWDETEKGEEALGDYNDAKDELDEYEAFVPTEYEKSEDVLSAEDALNDHLANKPGEYQSQWKEQLDELMKQIMGREKFSYNFNEDALYQQYKDNYIQQAKMAMADTMGQAAAMTGGYGSSYAQSVGQQAYQGQLNNLNDIIPELYKMALDKYNMEGQDLLNQYGLIMDREDMDYDRYRDILDDWQGDRNYLQGVYDNALNFDYGKHMDEQDTEYQIKEDEYQRLLDEVGITGDDYYKGGDIFRTEQANKNNEAWNEYEATENNNRYQNEEGWRDAEWDRNEDRYQDSMKGTTGNNGIRFNADGSVDLTSIPGINTDDASWFDEKGNFKQAEYLGQTKEGKSSFRIDGKTVTFPIGTNPYTQTENPDKHYGTFKNGYQPNNVGGKKLSKSGIKDYVNGVEQNVWQTEDGKLYIWDGLQNQYLEYQQ